MRLVLHLGTRAGASTIDAALAGNLDPVTVLVPVEERLLGDRWGKGDLSRGLAAIAEVVRDRALDRARTAATRSEKELTEVFGADPEPSERVHARLLDAPLEESLAEALDEHAPVDDLHVARDALDVLDDAGIRLEGVLDARDVALVTR